LVSEEIWNVQCLNAAALAMDHTMTDSSQYCQSLYTSFSFTNYFLYYFGPWFESFTFGLPAIILILNYLHLIFGLFGSWYSITFSLHWQSSVFFAYYWFWNSCSLLHNFSHHKRVKFRNDTTDLGGHMFWGGAKALLWYRMSVHVCCLSRHCHCNGLNVHPSIIPNSWHRMKKMLYDLQS
jgi:hypothetical protein